MDSFFNSLSKAYIKPYDGLKPYLDKEVGYIRVNKSFKHRNNKYPCANWWQESEIQTGIYPLTLKQSKIDHFNYVELQSSFKSIIINDFFPSPCSNNLSNVNYKSKNIGHVKDINFNFSIGEAIYRTGLTNDDKDFYINMDLVQPLLDDARINLIDLKKNLDDEFKTYVEEGDGNCNNNLSLVQYSSDVMSCVSVVIFILKMKLKDYNNMTPLAKDNYYNNTEWVSSLEDSFA